MIIQKIHAREIIDSRGNPTLEACVTLKNGIVGKASVPSGASTGVHEALELRDGDIKRYLGKGVLKAVKNVNNKIAKVLTGRTVTSQQALDEAMIRLDKTENKSKLGANAILGVSLACARVAAYAKKMPLYRYIRSTYRLDYKRFVLPIPTFNILNGGAHADNNLDVQELMVIPAGIKKFKERVRAGYEIFHALGKVLKNDRINTNVGNEGGYAPSLPSTDHSIRFIMEAIREAGYFPGENIFIGTDVGASELYDKRTKKYSFVTDKVLLTNDEMNDRIADWVTTYPFLYVEDPLEQDEWSAWKSLTERVSASVLLVGDDLFVTNVKRLEHGIGLGVANAILIKVNQIGTLSETIHCVNLAQKNNYKVIISHRSGETTDDFIADLSVAVNSDFVKMGSSRGERVCKYNRIMEIEDELS